MCIDAAAFKAGDAIIWLCLAVIIMEDMADVLW